MFCVLCILMWTLDLQLGTVKIKGWSWKPWTHGPLPPCDDVKWGGCHIPGTNVQQQPAKGNPVAWTIINGPHFVPYFNIIPGHCMYPRIAMFHVRNTLALRPAEMTLKKPENLWSFVPPFCFFVFFKWNLVLRGLFSTSLRCDSTIFNVAGIHLKFFFLIFYVYFCSYTIFPQSKSFYLLITYQTLVKDYSIKIRHVELKVISFSCW